MNRITKFAGAALAVVAVTAGGVSYAADEPSSSTIYSCVDKNGSIRIVAVNEACESKETAVNWSTTGPAGAQGPVGPAGPPGTGGNEPVPNSTVIGTLTIPGIQGGDPAGDTIELRGYSFDVKSTPTTGGGGMSAGKVSFSDFSVVKEVDTASPTLLVAVASGKHYPEATLTIYQEGTTTVAETFELGDVIVSSLRSHDEGTQTGIPLEDVTMNFQKIEQTYAPTSGSPVIGGWDIKRNVKL